MKLIKCKTAYTIRRVAFYVDAINNLGRLIRRAGSSLTCWLFQYKALPMHHRRVDNEIEYRFQRHLPSAGCQLGENLSDLDLVDFVAETSLRIGRGLLLTLWFFVLMTFLCSTDREERTRGIVHRAQGAGI